MARQDIRSQGKQKFFTRNRMFCPIDDNSGPVAVRAEHAPSKAHDRCVSLECELQVSEEDGLGGARVAVVYITCWELDGAEGMTGVMRSGGGCGGYR